MDASQPAHGPYVPDDHVRQILAALESKHIRSDCPMCGNPKFMLIAGYLPNLLHRNLANISLFGQFQTLPAVALVCTNCGFISQHSLAQLGLHHLVTGTEKGEGQK